MKDIEPLVSICCITYNHENYIRDAIEGFLMQKTSFPIEIIIHDDASTDNTANIIKEYAEKHPNLIVPIYQTENQYSKGIKPFYKYIVPKVKGKYIALCEGDDYWIDPNKIQKQVDFLENNPDYGIIFTDADFFYEISGKIIRNVDEFHKRKIPTGNVLNFLLYGNPYKACTSLFRATYIKNITDFFYKGFMMGDRVLWLHIATQTKFAYLNESTSLYRVRIESASRFKQFEQEKAFSKNNYKMLLYFSDKYNIPIDKKRMKKVYVKALILYLVVNKKYFKLSSFVYHPFLITKLLIKENVIRPLYKFINIK